jgi:hypothetical protein
MSLAGVSTVTIITCFHPVPLGLDSENENEFKCYIQLPGDEYGVL